MFRHLGGISRQISDLILSIYTEHLIWPGDHGALYTYIYIYIDFSLSLYIYIYIVMIIIIIIITIIIIDNLYTDFCLYRSELNW